MAVAVPKATPQISGDDLRKILEHRKNHDRVALVGLRGYFLDSLGKPQSNDRGIYDDAILLVVRNGKGDVTRIERFNANTDPSAFRKGIAVLKPGSWRYLIGLHKMQYKALRQASKVTVVRDGVGDDTGMFGINIHKGGFNSTSSLGCQTIYPAQWPWFIKVVESEMKSHSQSTIGYELMDEIDRRKVLG